MSSTADEGRRHGQGTSTGSGAHPASRPEGRPDGAPGGPAGPADAETLRRDIEGTRSALGDTVEALAEKADVRGQALRPVDKGREQVQRLQDQARGAAGTARERPVPVGAIAAAVAVVGIAWMRRRRRKRRQKLAGSNR